MDRSDPATATKPKTFVVPTKHILSRAHLDAFLRSPAHAEILNFIDALNDSVVGKKLSDAGEGSEVGAVLDTADASEQNPSWLFSTLCWRLQRKHHR